jgi:His/Glu/Gln/Arg/opine family amino acid ABC transporter permease subunit
MEEVTLTAEALEAGLISEPPREMATGPADWVKKNLVSSPGNTLLTFAFTIISLGAIKWIAGIAFTESWTAVLTNMRLLFSYNYPAEQYGRVWFSLGMLLAVIAATAAVWNLRPRMSLAKITSVLVAMGGLLVLISLLAPEIGDDGEAIESVSDSADSNIGIRFFKSILSPILAFGNPTNHLYFFASGLLLIGLGGLAWFVADHPREKFVSFEALIVGFAIAVLAVIWLVRFGRNEFLDGEFIKEPGTANPSTKKPWTVMIGMFLAVYFFVHYFRDKLPLQPIKSALLLWWFAGPAFLMFIVLRDPAFDRDHLLGTDIPMAIAFMVGGGLILYFLTNPELGETARSIAAGIFAFALLNWVAAFFGWWPMLQKARVSFLLLALFALMAPTFAGEHKTRLRYATYWAGTMFLVHWLITGINTPSTLEIAAPPFLGGFTLTLILFYYVMIVSFPLGVLLALGRTSKMPIFRMLSTTYIEFVRGIPLITVLIFFSIMVNLFLPDGMSLSQLAAIFIGYSLFSAAYLAENIRGGLQSIRRGQFEASDALGLTTLQRTLFIVLPQALRVTIPNLVGQAIATFKETSLISIIGAFDFLRVANSSIPNQSNFLGQKEAGLLFISFVYWVFAYSMSKASQNLERQLGVGDQ